MHVYFCQNSPKFILKMYAFYSIEIMMQLKREKYIKINTSKSNLAHFKRNNNDQMGLIWFILYMEDWFTIPIYQCISTLTEKI